MKNLALFIFGVAILFTSCTATKKQSKESPVKTVSFIKGQTIEQVLAKAKAENKLVFVDFYIDACAPCKVMDETAFTQRNVFNFYNRNFINFKVDAIDFDYVTLAQQYKVREYPTLVYLDGDGKILMTHYGGASATDLLELAKTVKSKAPVL